jgi:hypothetical protein
MNLSFDAFLKIFALIRDVFVVPTLMITFLSYRSQHRQRAIDNSRSLLEVFKESIPEEDREIWREVLFNTYESTGAEPGCFVVYTTDDVIEQKPISSLFITEGQGLYIPQAKFNLDTDISDLDLSPVRRIAEELNLIGYEILYGNVDLRIIYYEIGQIMDSIYDWIDEVKNKDENIESSFPYFIKMYRKYKRKIEKLPQRIYVNFC